MDSDVNNSKSEDEELKPRDYQSKLLEICKEKNTILYLPTGSGKTFIAVMLIRHKSGELKSDDSSPPKRTFFLVNTVALVAQQADYIRRHTPLTVGHFSGDMNVDDWKKSTWQIMFDRYEVLVMTAEIFRNILLHNYFSPKLVNLVIFDECHHAVNNHNMVQIMKIFRDLPVNEQPLVLGLTATILNSNCKINEVLSEVHTLEETYRSKIVTVDDTTLIKGKYSTKPQEIPYKFETPDPPSVILKVKGHIDMIIKWVESAKLETQKVMCVPRNVVPMSDLDRINKRLKNILTEVSLHVEYFGIYGGSISAWKHLIQLERLRAKADSEKLVNVLICMITTLTMIRKMLEDHMADCDGKERIYKYSTPKLLKLLGILRKVKPGNGRDVPRGIIFVERRFTAKVLYLILKYVNKYDSDFEFLQPDFIVGFQNNPAHNVREGALEKKWNKAALVRFNLGETNIVVSSLVLEEGIDIPQCNLVVRYDLPNSYRSYIQSKGRARHKNSLYCMLIANDEYNQFMRKYRTFQEIEQLLEKELSCRNECDESLDFVDCDDEDEPPYCVVKDGAVSQITINYAITVVNWYCSLLPQDRFTDLAPNYFIEKNNGCTCFLQLPINSPIKELIKGKKKSNKKRAKQSVALEACKRLHQAGELDDNLAPRGRTALIIDDTGLFPNWKPETTEPDQPKPGTKRKKRSYRKKVPDCLCKCAPQSHITLYLHIIKLAPGYPRPQPEESRKLVFYNLIGSSQEFAILSSKQLPRICDFPVFLNIGQVNVSVKCNYRPLQLTDDDISKLRNFNTMMFYDLLDLCWSFMIVDLENEENSYFVVPTKPDIFGEHNIDWDIVNAHPRIPKKCQPSDDLRANIHVTAEDYQLAVVEPWYRSVPSDQKYVVTKICNNMTPQSPFPTKEFRSFEHYYEAKYDITVMSPEQPLVEVKAISTKLNCLRPRGRPSHSASKRKRQELQEDFEEHFIPELCFQYKFPAVLWLKATCLPSILHRVTYLCLVEELRLKIAFEAEFGVHEDIALEPLKVDEVSLQDNETSSSSQCSALIAKLARSGTSDLLNSEPMPWDKDEREPVDIDREYMENIMLIDVLYYDSFISKIHKTAENINGGSSSLECDGIVSNVLPRYSMDWSPIQPPNPIKILKKTLSGYGPHQHHILQALTAASANDIMNMERLETLGDSFLKFSVSLFLFLHYPNVDEGRLTAIKGKMVGNRSLCYCGMARDISNMIKVQEFVAREDGTPPGFCVPRKLEAIILEADLCPRLLYEICLPPEDQLNGSLSPSTENRLEDQLLQWEEDNNLTSTAENFIGMQSISDKTVADCVEALIGAYLKGYGIEGAAKLLAWFQIIPREIADMCEMLRKPSASAYVGDPDEKEEKITVHLNKTEIRTLEAILQYRFNDHSFLLQAVTHPSFFQNRVTDCYQRLEFLGDAILDFLITCYIFENCGNLTPGELTDLRSALVNNITFGCLAVRNGIHKFCKYESSKLFDKVDAFVRYQESHNHEVNEKVLYLFEEHDCNLAESVDVPKVLGDLFESIAGAIYLDSGNNLTEVWRVFYHLMKKEIKEFSECVPKQPVRILYETFKDVQFLKSKKIEDSDMVMVPLEVRNPKAKDGKDTYYGFGDNKSNAKRAAARMALKNLI